MVLAYTIAALLLLMLLALPGTWHITLPIGIPLIAIFLWGVREHRKYH